MANFFFLLIYPSRLVTHLVPVLQCGLLHNYSLKQSSAFIPILQTDLGHMRHGYEIFSAVA